MAMTPVTSQSAALTANGTQNGYIVVANNANFVLGAYAYLNATGLPALAVKIVEIGAGGKIGLRTVPDNRGPSGPSGLAWDLSLTAANYGRSDMSAYTTAASASITQPAGAVFGDGSGIPAIFG